MHASRKAVNIAPDDLDEIAETDVENQQTSGNRRRLADSINARGRKLKLDRRLEQNDRRTNTASEYNGPARRKTIDQRSNTKDRRSKD